MLFLHYWLLIITRLHLLLIVTVFPFIPLFFNFSHIHFSIFFILIILLLLHLLFRIIAIMFFKYSPWSFNKVWFMAFNCFLYVRSIKIILLHAPFIFITSTSWFSSSSTPTSSSCTPTSTPSTSC